MTYKVIKESKIETIDKYDEEITYFRYSLKNEDGETANLKTMDKEFSVGDSVEIK